MTTRVVLAGVMARKVLSKHGLHLPPLGIAQRADRTLLLLPDDMPVESWRATMWAQMGTIAVDSEESLVKIATELKVAWPRVFLEFAYLDTETSDRTLLDRCGHHSIIC